jgi:hypothetical protein
MRKFVFASAVSLGVMVLIAGTNPVRVAADSDNNRRISIVDDCDPTDPGWAPTGGCFREGGRVNLAEFNSYLIIPNIAAVVGHPAWRMSPSYLTLESGKDLRVRNIGGRTHTFTEVTDFGAGFIGPPNLGLNFGLSVIADGCAGSNPVPIPAGTRGADVEGLSLGNHNFQCCIHPWMRAVVKVVAKDDDDN